ncbi:MAG: Ppx/GppA family phosphatase [Planctomycetes bacterium]|nr:Ppx/GppA family phosphatase [Planctomycetota bacterium]
MTPFGEQEGNAPLVVAVIDIGSNSVRMMIAQVHEDGQIEELERMQRAVRLGHDTFVTGKLSRETMNATIGILADYKRTLGTYGVRHLRAVATSAVREAENADAFLNRIQMAVDLDVEVIDTPEESRLTVSAVREAIGDMHAVNQGYSLVVEVGGGSASLTILESGKIAASESYNLGSIRLQEALSTSQQPGRRAADLLQHHINNIVAAIRRTLPLSKVRSFIAIGGDARFAARQVGKPTEQPEVTRMTPRDFDALVRDCVELTTQELASKYEDEFITSSVATVTKQLASEYGLVFSQAETLVPALLAYQTLFRATKARRILVSNVSMRHGLLLDMARYVRGEEDKELAESVIHTAKTIGEKYRCDPKHAQHVADLAVRLFDALQKQHGLTGRHRLLLQVAAILHEVGGFVSGRAHHKHTYYLVANSEIFGLRPEDLAIVAHVARYHRRSCPKPSHLDYMALARENRIVVNKLAAILRVADALDRGHAQHIRDFAVSIEDDVMIMRIPGVSDLALERHALLGKADLFEDIYGLRIELEEGTFM